MDLLWALYFGIGEIVIRYHTWHICSPIVFLWGRALQRATSVFYSDSVRAGEERRTHHGYRPQETSNPSWVFLLSVLLLCNEFSGAGNLDVSVSLFLYFTHTRISTASRQTGNWVRDGLSIGGDDVSLPHIPFVHTNEQKHYCTDSLSYCFLPGHISCECWKMTPWKQVQENGPVWKCKRLS